MDDLIARLEGLSAPSREVDALIWWEHGEGKALCPRCDSAGKAVSFYYGAEFDSDGDFKPETLLTYRGPAYTASLDAALTLVPEGWNWMAGERNQGKFRAYVNNNQPAFVGMAARKNSENIWHETVAVNAAIALCICALRARTGHIEAQGGRP